MTCIKLAVSLLLLFTAIDTIRGGPNTAPCVITVGSETVNNVFPSCAKASCPEGWQCVETILPARKISVAQCFSRDAAGKFPTSEEYSCTSGFDICPGDNLTCIDSYEEGRFLTAICAPIGCSKNAPCPGILMCEETPEFLQDSFQSVCVATKVEFGMESCETLDKNCPPGAACHDFIFEGMHIGTDCGPSAETFVAESCCDLHCPAPLLECQERQIEGRGSLAQCLFKQSVDKVAVCRGLHATLAVLYSLLTVTQVKD